MNYFANAGYLEAFLALFVAIDMPGLIPIYMGAVAGMSLVDQTRVLNQAIIWAAFIGTAFFLAGNVLLAYLDITVADFQIAGGLLLVALSLHDLTSSSPSTKLSGLLIGVVPLAIPLIVGPAVMTVGISMIQAKTIGTTVTIAAFILNLLLLWLAGIIVLRIGQAVTGFLMAASKVVMILLAAIGVSMMLRGLIALNIISSHATGATGQ